MNTNQLITKLRCIPNIIAVCEFGSYRSDFWIKSKSDIDLAIITAPNVSFMDTFDIEDELISLFQSYYNYDNIHITFVYFNEFSSKYAQIAIDSEHKFIINELLWFDFQHYVLKFIRTNEPLKKTLKFDEQFTYFGGIIDESLL